VPDQGPDAHRRGTHHDPARTPDATG